MARSAAAHVVLLLAAAATDGCRVTSHPPAAARQPARAEQAQPAPPEVMGSVVAANATWGDAFARGDATVLASLYLPDAVLMAPEGDVTGREAIQHYFARQFQTRSDTVLATSTTTELLEVAGARAYEAGTITYTVAPRQRPAATRAVTTRYATFWQQDSVGAWRVRLSLRSHP